MILKRPIITEKTMREAQLGKFTFEVDGDASKTDIKKTVAKQFGVDVISVATLIMKGKSARFGKMRREKALAPWKKAIVTLKKGQTISLFDVQGGEK